MGVLVSVAGDFSTNARNDIVFVWFYNVISTEVRVSTRTKWRNPPRKRYLFVYASKSSLPGDCHASLAMTMRYGFSLGLIMFNLIKRRVRPYNNVIPRE